MLQYYYCPECNHIHTESWNINDPAKKIVECLNCNNLMIVSVGVLFNAEAVDVEPKQERKTQ